jgi:hypothetical protein
MDNVAAPEVAFYAQALAQGLTETEAADLTDWHLCRRLVKERLAKRGEDREPTAAEIMSLWEQR